MMLTLQSVASRDHVISDDAETGH